jgi:hypothetical protein
MNRQMPWEIAEVEELLRACVALSDWSMELRLIQREAAQTRKGAG